MKTITTLLVPILHLLIALPAFPASYSIKGALTFEGHGLGEPPGYKVQPREREFEVTVDDCTWTIKMVLVGNKDYDYCLSRFDGTNILYASKLKQAAFDRLQDQLQERAGGRQSSLYQSCMVESGPVPRNLGSIANPYPWLALCSGCYFKSLTNGLATDLHPPNEHPSDLSARRDVPCDFSLSSLPPYLPIRVLYWWTNTTTPSKGKNKGVQPLPAPFNGRFLAARFQSGPFTNINGMAFPTQFEMREYRPLPTASSAADFRCTRIIHGSVTEISFSNRPQTNDVLKGTAIVSDIRVSSDGTIVRYPITNGSIPPADDITVERAKAQANRQLEAIRRQTPHKP